jgi:tyramine---L-glutamate ligase
MRLFVYEWTVCARGAPASLAREGLAMLQALMDDFARLENVEPVTLVQEGFKHRLPGQLVHVRGARDEADRFREQAARADLTLVIAPETGGILAERCRWVEQAGGRLLGPSSAAVLLASDKLALARAWERHCVPSPPTCPVSESRFFPAVLKPRDGAGSMATFLVRNELEQELALQAGQFECCESEFIAQPLVQGVAASVAFLVSPKKYVALPPAVQEISEDGRFRYLGGVVPLELALARRASDLGQRALAAVPGLLGFVGVDLVLGAAGDYAIEINPRLTTSYIGLRQLAEDNLAKAMLDIALGRPVEPLRWRPEIIRFKAP